MIKINLIGEGKRPTAVRRKKETGGGLFSPQTLPLFLLLAGLLPGLVLTLGEWWLLKTDLDEKTARAASLQRQYDELKPYIAQVEEFKRKKAELDRKIGVINDLKLNQIGPVKVMDYVSRALPELVWLDKMDVNRGSIRLSGRGQNENAVANFVENLDKVEEFKEPVFRVMKAAAGGVYSFDMTISYSLKKPQPEGEGQQPAAGEG